MTSRAFWWAAGVLLALVLVGLFLFRGEWIALALPLAVYLTLGWLERPTETSLTAVRQLSTDRISEGLPVNGSLTVNNVGSALPEVDVRDTLSAGLRLTTGDPRRDVRPSAGERIDL